ncbi:hypothetical protein Trihar35433_6459 [Trichoderma harzianum]|nr:hypothetical protein Trihar35433_6459 [Trichoderma harzianum]
MTKRTYSDRRPYETRPVSLKRFVKSQEALDNLSRYEEVSRQFAQEFPQIAWSLAQHSWIPCFLSPNTGRQENRTTAPADVTIAADSKVASPTGGLAYDSEVAATADYDISMYIDDNCFDDLTFTPTSASSSPTEQPGHPDSFTPPESDTDFYPTCDLKTLTSQLFQYNEVQESKYGYNCSLQNWNAEQRGEQRKRPCTTISKSLAAPPVEPMGSDNLDNEALADASQVDKDRMNQIMIDLNQLESRLRGDARRQLDAIIGEMCL